MSDLRFFSRLILIMRNDNLYALGTLAVIALVILKLTGVVGWSWWWVFAPWWIHSLLLILQLIIKLIRAK